LYGHQQRFEHSNQLSNRDLACHEEIPKGFHGVKQGGGAN
jgi:hypothetical protein